MRDITRKAMVGSGKVEHDHVVLSYKSLTKYTQQLFFSEFIQWIIRGFGMLRHSSVSHFFFQDLDAFSSRRWINCHVFSLFGSGSSTALGREL